MEISSRTTVLLLWPLLLVAACGDPGPAPVVELPPGSHQPCGQDPLGCPAGETCWGVRQGLQTTMMCLTAPSGIPRDAECAQGNTPTCSPGYFCGGIPLAPGPTHCWAYCVPESPATCLPGDTCQLLAAGDGSQVGVCLHPNVADGGM